MPPPLPTFLIIGAQKSGTRWLRDSLGRHPAVFTADRELEFFNHRYLEGASWYRSQFVGWDGEAIVGEATPGYMFHTDGPQLVAARVEALLGTDVGLVALLRDPVARARSAYMHHLRRGRIPVDADPVDYFRRLDPESDPLGLVSGGWYGRSLEPYFDRFGARLLVEFHEDVVRAPEEVFTRTLHHIGGAGDEVPEGLHDVRNSGTDQLSGTHPDHAILSLTDDRLREVLQGHLAEDVSRLVALLGRPVPWDR